MIYWIAATFLVVINLACVVANILMLPGNWLMVGSLCLFLLATDDPTGPDWKTLLVVIVLAIVGEILEAFTGSASAAKKGASRRAMVLSLAVSIAGSIAGATMLTVPIPVIGTAIGAVCGAAAGAFAGAWLGEAWKGTDAGKRTEIGTAAMNGRMIGMLAKLAVGVAIFVVQLVNLW
ncbi:MAG: DUF456 domain-containing protein [Planctomycetaceae bacterium]